MTDFLNEIIFKETTKSIEWNGKTLTINTGKVARLAEGAVMVTMGRTKVLCVVSAAKQVKEGIDFFPLTVNYLERFYASGKFPGGFNKREGKPTKRETLISRVIDRPIRPLFPEGFFNEVQICCTVLSYDSDAESDILAMIGASAALRISGIPFLEAIAGARVGYINGEYVLNPTAAQLLESSLDLVVAGTKSSVLMVESEAQQLSEEVMLGAVMYGHQHFQSVIQMIDELAAEAGKPAWQLEIKDDKALAAQLHDVYGKELENAYTTADKASRRELLATIKTKAASMVESGEYSELEVMRCLKKLEKKLVRGKIVKSNWRIDGRDADTIRPIVCEVDLLPQVHGSALFTRGETQALVVTTLGTGQDEQLVDDITGNSTEKFMLHYNFPPYSVGEAGPLRPPGRRDIGHGDLARRATVPVMPKHEDFPYTTRVVSEITESNGSSSMATVCGTTLSLMAAGVPISAPVAGIAMGLVLEGKDYVVLSDILGDEDNLGDMDFKVAGTEAGITALQMDIKVNGISHEIMEVALAKAKTGRTHILNRMLAILPEARTELNANAPRITTIKIDKDKIREVIGSGGKVIRELCERANAKIDIEDDGTIKIATVSAADTELALQLIGDIVATPEVGRIYEGKVVKVVEFGAFVNYIGNLEGLLHISEMGTGGRVENVTDILNEGDPVTVKVLSVEKSGKVRLTMRLDSPIPPAGEERPGGKRGGGRSSGDRDRGDRGSRGERGGRGGDRDRGDRGGRGEYSGSRSSGDRDRGDRGGRGEYGGRSSGDRDRGEYSGSRSNGDRDRSERGGERTSERGERGERSSRGSGERTGRGNGDRDRGERGGGDRPQSGNRGPASSKKRRFV